jgi:hypothetical protein
LLRRRNKKKQEKESNNEKPPVQEPSSNAIDNEEGKKNAPEMAEETEPLSPDPKKDLESQKEANPVPKNKDDRPKEVEMEESTKKEEQVDKLPDNSKGMHADQIFQLLIFTQNKQKQKGTETTINAMDLAEEGEEEND